MNRSCRSAWRRGPGCTVADIVSPEIRSRIMRRIGPKDTKPELILRRALHAAGFRFRLHARDLPGKPDLVLPKHRAVIFVNGCFWHRHDCVHFRWPDTRADFWKRKLDRNAEVDRLAHARLHDSGWRVLVVWECSLRRPTARHASDLVEEVVRWLHSETMDGDIRGASTEST